LALSLHGLAGDNASRDILLTDLFTAFAQRLAGEPIALQPVPMSWREWSQRCAALATHPAVVDSREYWLEVAARPTLRVARQDMPEPPRADDYVRLPSSLAGADLTEIDDARRRLKLPIEELLLAALGRTVASTVGDGAVTIDLGGAGRSVLKPEIDPRRTIGWFSTVYPVTLPCSAADGTGATRLLGTVHDTLAAVPHHGIGYGLLRYLYGPTARRLGATAPADMHLSYVGAIPDLPDSGAGDAPVQFDTDTAMPAREAVPGLGHAIELRVYRSAGVLHLDWWYDQRRLEPEWAQTLARTFSGVLTELSREAIIEDEMETASEELEFVDLSEPDLDLGEANARH
jgi:phthiocerol/phenolphthiocerol synthesis type-I polyketide synthase E